MKVVWKNCKDCSVELVYIDHEYSLVNRSNSNASLHVDTFYYPKCNEIHLRLKDFMIEKLPKITD